MNSLEILIKNPIENEEDISYLQEFNDNIKIDWRLEARKDVELYYQISFTENTPGVDTDIYYFINRLLIDKIINININNIANINIVQNGVTYTINENNISGISTIKSDFGAQTLIILKDLDETANLPFVKNEGITVEE